MYETFFGLKREPFSIAPDPHFLYMSERHREALAHLTYGLRRGAGFVLLTGEIGAGKTTVWRAFLEQLPANFDVANVVNPKLAVRDLLMRICEDLHVELPGQGDTSGRGVDGNAQRNADGGAVDLIDAIHGHLLLAFARGRRTLIVVDEAQALSADVMEQLRLLTNLDTSDRKLQVLLIGQPELRTILEQPALEPLAQRVVARFHLPALAEAETTRYIAHRMAVAGLSGEVPFEADALSRIHRLCRGVPRRINVLCDRALLLAQTESKHRINRDDVDRAALEVFDIRRTSTATTDRKPKPTWPAWLAVGSVAGAALVAGALLGPLIASAVNGGARSTRATAPATPVTPETTSESPSSATASATASATLPPSAETSVAARPAPGSAAATPPVRSAQKLATATPTPPSMPASTSTTTSAANNAASAAKPMVVPAMPSSLVALFDAPATDEPRAWRALALLWNAQIGPGDPCEAAAKQSLQCYRGRGGLAPIRQLGRPCLLELIDERGRSTRALLVGLGSDHATLRINNADTTVPLTALAKVWRGEFATLWRAPPAYRAGDTVGREGPVAGWLGQRLGMLDGAPAASASDEAMKSRVFAFQLANGLAPDGLTGPLTLMQLNRASGVDEPRLTLLP